MRSHSPPEMRRSYAYAVDAAIGRPEPRCISLDDWVPPQIPRALPAPSMRCDPLTVDIMDHNFVAFHSCLREYMMDEYGLLRHSLAVDLHDAISPAISFRDTPQALVDDGGPRADVT